MSNKEKYHNKGEQDRSEGKYKEPNSVGNMLTSSIKSEDRMREENKSYRDGWKNTDKQKKG